MRLLCLLLLACLASSQSTIDSLINSYDNCHAYTDPLNTPLSPTIVVFWSVRAIDNAIDIGLACDIGDTPSWCAIGWKNAPARNSYVSMLDADVNLAALYPSPQVADWRSGAHYPPRNATTPSALCLADMSGLCLDTSLSTPGATDTVSNATVVETIFNPGQLLDPSPGLIARWTRPITTLDPLDYNFTTSLATVLIASSSSSLSGVGYHNTYFSAADKWSFLTPPGCPNSCNGNGACNKGCCSCNVGFAGADCSISTATTYASTTSTSTTESASLAAAISATHATTATTSTSATASAAATATASFAASTSTRAVALSTAAAGGTSRGAAMSAAPMSSLLCLAALLITLACNF